MKLNYVQLRQIIGLAIKNKTFHDKIKDFMNGAEFSIEVSEFLNLVYDSAIDRDLIEILTSKMAEEIDAIKGIEVLTDFFGYFVSNKKKLNAMLTSFSSKKAIAK